MIMLELKVSDPTSMSGFVMGDLLIKGEKGGGQFYCMVVLSAALLMDQLLAWHNRHGIKKLEFNPVDCSGTIVFSKEESDIAVSARGSGIGRIEIHDFLLEILRACHQLAEFVGKLPPEDAGRCDFEDALLDLQNFMEDWARDNR